MIFAVAAVFLRASLLPPPDAPRCCRLISQSRFARIGEKFMAKRKVRKVRANQRGARSASKPAKGRKITTLDAAALLASVKHHPGPGNARTFAASRLPQSFQTVIDPNKNPPQPFQPLPPPTGKAPFHLSLDT